MPQEIPEFIDVRIFFLLFYGNDVAYPDTDCLPAFVDDFLRKPEDTYFPADKPQKVIEQGISVKVAYWDNRDPGLFDYSDNGVLPLPVADASVPEAEV